MFSFIFGFLIALLVLGTLGSFMSVVGPVLIPLFTGVCVLKVVGWFLHIHH